LLKKDLDHPWGFAQKSKFSVSALGYTYFSYVTGYALGPSLRELHTVPARQAAAAAAPWLALAGSAVAVLLALALLSLPRRDCWRLLAWATAFCILPAAIIGAVSDFAGFGYNVRHAIWAFAPLSVVLGTGVARGRPRWLAWCAVTVLGLAFAVAHINRLTAPAHANEDVRGAATYLVDQGPAAPTFVLSGYMSKPLAVYLPVDWPLFALPNADADQRAADAATASVRAHATTGQHFWLVYTREFHGDPRGELFKALDKTFHLEQVVALAGVRVYRGRVAE
jgi:hypothetical protein